MARALRLGRSIAACTVLLALLLAAGCGEPSLDRRTSGDPRAGLSVYKFAGCAACHAIAAVSVGSTGPALDGEGNRRAAPWLRAMLPAHTRTAAHVVLSPRDREDLVSYVVSLR